MIPIIMLGVILAASAAPKLESPICAVGRAALKDLRVIDKYDRGEAYYGIRLVNTSEPDILETCPSLKAAMPRDLPFVTSMALDRIKDISSSNPVIIFGIESPYIFPDGRRAVIRMGHYCNGSCGSLYTVSYTLTALGWKHDDFIPLPAKS
jgi:hypothetical protein